MCGTQTNKIKHVQMTFYGSVSQVYMNSTLINNFFSHSLFKYDFFTVGYKLPVLQNMKLDDRFFFELQKK